MSVEAARMLLARAQAVGAAPVSPVPSPCNSVCRMDEATGWCRGCLRTLDEIGSWGALADPQRRAVWRRIESRAVHAAVDPRVGGMSR